MSLTDGPFIEQRTCIIKSGHHREYWTDMGEVVKHLYEGPIDLDFIADTLRELDAELRRAVAYKTVGYRMGIVESPETRDGWRGEVCITGFNADGPVLEVRQWNTKPIDVPAQQGAE